MVYSPAVKRIHDVSNSTPETSPEAECFKDMSSAFEMLKNRCDYNSRATVKVLVAAINGDMVQQTKCATELSKRLGVKRSLVYGGKRIRNSILKNEKSVFAYTQRKTRNDVIDDSITKQAFDFWLRPGITRTTNNKNDIKRVKLAKNKYSSHSCMILEKTQSEVFQEFKVSYPNIKIGQRTFEKCKPYYVRSANKKDMSTCCCRTHVEVRSLFKSCMSFRKSVGNDTHIKVYQSLNELISDTLCEQSANTHQHKRCCLNRTCTECGVDTLRLLPQEDGRDEDVGQVTWEKYEYQSIKHKDGTNIRKLILVKKTTAPKDMFMFFKHLIETFPAHEFRAKWQLKQLKNIVTSLPIGHCIAVHDFSENYKCIAKEEIQAAYFQKIEVSIHVSVLYRHAAFQIDGIESTDSNPVIITEQFFVISPDSRHDHHFTHEVQQLVTDYLHSATDEFHTLHEFTDGCSSQYKSCHCIGRANIFFIFFCVFYLFLILSLIELSTFNSST